MQVTSVTSLLTLLLVLMLCKECGQVFFHCPVVTPPLPHPGAVKAQLFPVFCPGSELGQRKQWASGSSSTGVSLKTLPEEILKVEITERCWKCLPLLFTLCGNIFLCVALSQSHLTVITKRLKKKLWGCY